MERPGVVTICVLGHPFPFSVSEVCHRRVRTVESSEPARVPNSVLLHTRCRVLRQVTQPLCASVSSSIRWTVIASTS